MRKISALFYLVLTLNVFSSTGQYSINDIVSRIESERKKIENFQCTVEYHDYKTVEAIDRRIEKTQKHRELRIYAQSLADSKTRAVNNQVHDYQTQQVAYDSKGKIKTFHQFGHYDKSGKRELEPKKEYALWNGNEGIVFTDCDAPTAIVNQKKPVHVSRLRRPTYSFEGRFIEELKQAVSNGNSVIIQNDETQRITIKFNLNEEDHVGIIDPQKGYAIVQSEKYSNGNLVIRFKAEYQEVQKGIWFPMGGTIEDYFSNGMLITSTTMKVKSIKVNDPLLNETEVFHIKFPEGTRVEDLIKNCTYTVGDPTSFTPRGSTIVRQK